MTKEEYIKELKEEIAYEKEMIKQGDHIEERLREVKAMQAELRDLMSGKMRWCDD